MLDRFFGVLLSEKICMVRLPQKATVVAVARVQFTREISGYSASKRWFCPTGGFGIHPQLFAVVTDVGQFLLIPHANNAVPRCEESLFAGR